MKYVVAAIIQRDNRFLITQRLPSEKGGLRWEFPGGKIDAGETPEQALKREIKEELGIDIAVKEFFAENVYQYSDATIKIQTFRCRMLKGEIQKLEINDFKWLTLDEMKEYDITEADLLMIEKLMTKK